MSIIEDLNPFRGLAWLEVGLLDLEEQRPLAFTALTPIALVGYRNELQRT